MVDLIVFKDLSGCGLIFFYWELKKWIVKKIKWDVVWDCKMRWERTVANGMRWNGMNTPYKG